MALPQVFLDELKQRCDIENVVAGYLPLKRQGRTCKGLCPFHSEKTASMVVYPESQSFYCFGCGAGGDVISFVMRIENLGYIEALKLLAGRVGLDFPEDEREDPSLRVKPMIYEINRAAARFYHDCLMGEGGEAGREYFLSRGLSRKTIVHYGLGYAPPGWDKLRDFLHSKGFSDGQLIQAAVAAQGKNGGCYDVFRNRVIFPIIDLRKNIIGFGGRVLDDSKPKYLNTPDTPVFKKSRNLFSLNFAKGSADGRLILAEGYMDVIAVNQAGFPNVAATLGTALTPEQCRLIATYAKEVIIAYDSDGAGRTATSRAVGLLAEVGVKTRILDMKGAKDPDEFIKKFGAERFKLLLDGAGNVTEYQLSVLKAKYDLDEPDQRGSYLTEASRCLAAVESPIERDIYAGQLAAETGVGKEAILQSVSANRKRQVRQEKKKEWSAIQSGRGPALAPGGSAPRSTAAAIAEEGIIACLLSKPEEAARLEGVISQKDFITDEGREIFGIIIERLQQNTSVSLSDLAGALTEKQMGFAARGLARQQGIPPAADPLGDYVRRLQGARLKAQVQDAAQSDDAAAALAEELRRRKQR